VLAALCEYPAVGVAGFGQILRISTVFMGTCTHPAFIADSGK
jgi:hypothetical protein